MVDRLDQQAQRQALSDLMDGDVDAGGLARACRAWREDGEARADWYAYHLIGDVLRSEDLAHQPARDEAFLAALRTRLAAEPVVLAPQPVQAPAAPVAPQEARPSAAGGSAAGRRSLWRRSWAAPTAVAAGFMAVAGALVATRVAEAPVSPAGGLLVQAPAPLQAGVGAGSGFQSVSTAPSAVVPGASGQLIRDARLDRYLAAHKQYGGSSVLAMPAVSVRGTAPAATNR